MKGVLRRNRGALLLGGGLLAALVLAIVAAGAGTRGVLDPAGYDPDGAHALSVLLAQQGVDVTRTRDIPSTSQAATDDATVFVPLPSLLSTEELGALAALPGRLVVAQADPDALEALGLDVQVVDASEPSERDPACDDPVAANAGRALTGGFAYEAEGATSCYGGSVLLTKHVTLLGAAVALTNKQLAREGDAALAIGLLGQAPHVVWLVPSPTRAAFGERPVRSPDELVPHWLHLVRWQLLVATVLLALWRGRRLGRVVLERLPVVVRASETVEGHGRMYHAAGARGAAAEALRTSARRTLGRLAHGGALTPEVLVDLVTARSRWDAFAVRSLLYGPTPTDDDALVRLARDLDELVSQALTETPTREGAGT